MILSWLFNHNCFFPTEKKKTSLSQRIRAKDNIIWLIIATYISYFSNVLNLYKWNTEKDYYIVWAFGLEIFQN